MTSKLEEFSKVVARLAEESRARDEATLAEMKALQPERLRSIRGLTDEELVDYATLRFYDKDPRIFELLMAQIDVAKAEILHRLRTR